MRALDQTYKHLFGRAEISDEEKFSAIIARHHGSDDFERGDFTDESQVRLTSEEYTKFLQDVARETQSHAIRERIKILADHDLSVFVALAENLFYRSPEEILVLFENLLDNFIADKNTQSVFLQKIAENSQFTPEILFELGKKYGYLFFQAAAEHSNCSAELLIELAKENLSRVLNQIIKNKNCNDTVKLVIAKQSATHTEILEKFAKETDNIGILFAIAKHHNCNDVIRQILLSKSCAKDYNAKFLKQLIQNTQSSDVLSSLAHHEQLTDDHRYAIAQNSSASHDTLKQIKDHTKSVSVLAKIALNCNYFSGGEYQAKLNALFIKCENDEACAELLKIIAKESDNFNVLCAAQGAANKNIDIQRILANNIYFYGFDAHGKIDYKSGLDILLTNCNNDPDRLDFLNHIAKKSTEYDLLLAVSNYRFPTNQVRVLSWKNPNFRRKKIEFGEEEEYIKDLNKQIEDQTESSTNVLPAIAAASPADQNNSFFQRKNEPDQLSKSRILETIDIYIKKRSKGNGGSLFDYFYNLPLNKTLTTAKISNAKALKDNIDKAKSYIEIIYLLEEAKSLNDAQQIFEHGHKKANGYEATLNECHDLIPGYECHDLILGLLFKLEDVQLFLIEKICGIKKYELMQSSIDACDSIGALKEVLESKLGRDNNYIKMLDVIEKINSRPINSRLKQ